MSAASTPADSIRPSFLRRSDLAKVDGLNVGQPGFPRHNLMRSFNDKTRPVTMSRGVDKPRAPNFSSLVDRTPADLIGILGSHDGGANFLGEEIYWVRNRGVLLGKHKWEAEGGYDEDVATLSEIWDIRWSFRTREGAIRFHEEMLETAKMSGNNGYIDQLDIVRPKSAELASLDDCIEDLTFCKNTPKKRPGPNNERGRAMMAMCPQPYLQQYCAVFVIGTMVIKLYAIEGYNPIQGKLKSSVYFGPDGLLNITARVMKEWLDGERIEYCEDISSAPPSEVMWGDFSRCAKCGSSRGDLKKCSRCSKVAYCGRECQVAHYKSHKAACKREAAANTR